MRQLLHASSRRKHDRRVRLMNDLSNEVVVQGRIQARSDPAQIELCIGAGIDVIFHVHDPNRFPHLKPDDPGAAGDDSKNVPGQAAQGARQQRLAWLDIGLVRSVQIKNLFAAFG